jgi:hypothetical protein
MNWISVKDRLPFTQKMVLLYATPTERNWGIGYGWLDYATRKFMHRVSAALPVEFEDCTHWMPLPPPPDAIAEIEMAKHEAAAERDAHLTLDDKITRDLSSENET